MSTRILSRFTISESWSKKGKPDHNANSLYEAELQDPIQRAQKEMAPRNANAILIYNSNNKEKEKGFKDNFKSVALKKNLQHIVGNKSYVVIYQDIYSGYCFPNHFSSSLEEDTSLSFYAPLTKRIKGLFHHLETNQKVPLKLL